MKNLEHEELFKMLFTLRRKYGAIIRRQQDGTLVIMIKGEQK